MARQVIIKEGAFDHDPRTQINDNFGELFGGILAITKTLTISETQHLGTTPVLIVPGQGAGTAIMLHRWAGLVRQAGDAFIDNNLPRIFLSSTAQNAIDKLLPLNSLGSDDWIATDGAFFNSFIIFPNNGSDDSAYYLASDADNQGIYLDMDGAAYITGPITTTTLLDGGADYVVGDTGTINDDGGSGGSGATYIVTGVTAGAVTGYTITAPGTSYTPSETGTTPGGGQPGMGSGFLVTITDVAATQTGQITVTVYYSVITLP